MTLMNWEEINTKLKAIRDHVEKDAPKWIEAAALREEIVTAGLPNGELHSVGAAEALPKDDYRTLTLDTRLSDLGTALKAKNKSAVLENLSEAEKLVEALKRRS